MTDQERERIERERPLVAHHEAGHVVAAWAVHGVEVKDVRLHPEGGGTTTTAGATSSPLGELLISMAGGEVDNMTRGNGACFEPGNLHDMHDQNDAIGRMGIRDADDAGPRYCDAIERSGRVCEKFVRKNFYLIHEVATALEERGVLTGEELAAMLPTEIRDSLYRPKPRRRNRQQTELFG
jgi:hypothetical protein